ncbi:unnamed protein product [Lupinus luteus]|uniref:Uncharacterized protein n=1 Tax=Lupinus luteus TaxID=3873 RepID=A0AAV1Y210_LUPLU
MDEESMVQDLGGNFFYEKPILIFFSSMQTTRMASYMVELCSSKIKIQASRYSRHLTTSRLPFLKMTTLFRQSIVFGWVRKVSCSLFKTKEPKAKLISLTLANVNESLILRLTMCRKGKLMHNWR